MALSNAERQRRWMEKNRALHNFRRRKKNLGGTVALDAKQSAEKVSSLAVGFASSRPAQKSKVEVLRELIKSESDRKVEQPKQTIYRSDSGAIISEHQWNLLQKKKEAAKAGGYIIDEYSQ